jgi:hypothetical protein
MELNTQNLAAQLAAALGWLNTTTATPAFRQATKGLSMANASTATVVEMPK